MPSILPKQITDLTDRFVRVYDSERSAVVEFRRACDLAAESHGQEGVVVGAGAIIDIGKNLTAYEDERTRFVWRKLQEAVALTELEAYPELGGDLKLQMTTYCNPVQQAAECFMEELRRSANAPSSCTAEAKRASANVLSKINAEVDLFCAKCAANRNREIQSAAAQEFMIGNFRGLAGHETRSWVALNDCSARELLLDHNIPKQDTRKRPFLAAFSFLLLGIGAYVAYKLRNPS